MASRRQRFKAVVNIPVRRGRNDQPHAEAANLLVTSAVEKDVSSLTQERLDVTDPDQCISEINPLNNSRNENATPLQNNHENIKIDSPAKKTSPPKTFSRKRLKPSVNLPAIVRKPKETSVVDTEGAEVSPNNLSSETAVSGISRLPSPALSWSENNVEDSLPSCSKLPFSAEDTLSVHSAQNPLAEALPPDQTTKSSITARPKFSKPTPRLVDASSRRNSQNLSSDPEDIQKQPEFARPRLPSLKTSITPEVVLTSREISASNLLEDQRSAINIRPSPSGESSLPAQPEDVVDVETILKDSKSEKRTTHRRIRKNGAVEMLTRARRDFQNKFGDKVPEKDKLRMFDFIFYNPSTNPMKISEVTDSAKKDKLVGVEDNVAQRLAEESVDDVAELDDEDDKPMPAPQVKVGPDGSLIIDEQSLVIETTGSRKRKDDMANSAVVVDYGLGNATYNSFSNKVKSKDWSKTDTFKFYRALHSIGTDFLLMQSIFPNRTRKDLKQKFKKEDRLNRNLVDKALRYPLQFDLSQLEKDIEREENEEKERVEAVKKERELAKTLALADKKLKMKRSSVLAKSNVEDRGAKYPKRVMKRRKKETCHNSDIPEQPITEKKMVSKLRTKRSKKPLENASNEASSTSCSSDEFDMYAENEHTPIKVPQNVEDADSADASPSEYNPSRKLELPRVLSTADDIDVSSTDDEEVFLKKTVQTRYGRIPLRRIRSNSSEDDDLIEEQQLVAVNAGSESSETCSSPVPDASVSLEHPDLSNVEPGSLVIVTTPGTNNFKLFMVGPKGNGSTENKLSHIPVTITPEMFATLSANNMVAENAVIPGNNCTENLDVDEKSVTKEEMTE